MRLLWGGYHYSFYHLVASTGWRIHPNHTADKWQSQNGNPKDPIPAHMLLPTALQYTGKLRWTVREKKLEVENLDVNFSSTSTSLLIIPWSEKTVASAGVWPWSHSLSPGPIFFSMKSWKWTGSLVFKLVFVMHWWFHMWRDQRWGWEGGAWLMGRGPSFQRPLSFSSVTSAVF